MGVPNSSSGRLLFSQNTEAPYDNLIIEIERAADLTREVLTSKVNILCRTSKLEEAINQQSKKISAAQSIEDLRHLLRLAYASSSSSSNRSFGSFAAQVFDAISTVGWERVVFLSENLQSVHLQYGDAFHRRHVVKLKFDNETPMHIFDAEYELPDSLLISKNSTLRSVFENFVSTVDQFAELWNELEKLDEAEFVAKCKGQDSLASCSRSLLIGESLSATIKLDPKHPRSLPEFCLNGPESLVDQIKAVLDSKLPEWNEEYSVAQNLTEILGIDVANIRASQVLNLATGLTCAICYSGDSSVIDCCSTGTVDQVCGRCNQKFHKSCLYKYLSKQPQRQLSFGFVFGPCPYCKQNVKVKITL